MSYNKGKTGNHLTKFVNGLLKKWHGLIQSQVS